MTRRRQPYRFTSPWRPPRPARWPSAPAQHWLDRHEAEREQLDERLQKLVEAAADAPAVPRADQG